MSVLNPQTDLPRNGLGFALSGGADLWDEGTAGVVISDDYFEPSALNKFWIKISGVWKEAVTWIKVSGVWKQATPKVKLGGNWQ
jgi:hypothetical protein